MPHIIGVLILAFLLFGPVFLFLVYAALIGRDRL